MHSPLPRLATSRPRAWAGFDLRDGPLLMGILNLTPDSFSDGGELEVLDTALARARQLAADGADILDVGGESTRPGAAPVSPAEEADRILPLVEALVAEGYKVSVDTRRASVMQAAAQVGAHLINDVMALRGEGSLETAARTGLPLCLMHMQGEPQTMQANPSYSDVVAEVYAHLEQRVAACEAAGIPRQRLCLDPGIGFGKTLEHNLALLAALDTFHALGCPLLVGTSRKRFIAALDAPHDPAPKQRIPGSLTSALWACAKGAAVLRVHDVAETRQALAVWQALDSATGLKEETA